MITSHETIKVLILDESQNDAEKLISLLRSAGRATRAHRITSEAQLTAALKEQVWDLLLTRMHAGECSAEQAINQIKRLEKDLPVILLSDNNDSAFITKGLQMGMRDVVPFDEDERIKLVINRELNSLQDRRGRRLAEIALHESEKRCNLLLANAQNPIAYVLDGMHISANETYMNMFGYSEEELAGMPLIDMIDSPDHAKFKDFLKQYKNNKSDDAEFSCTCVKNDGAKTPVRMKFAPAEYDGEACTQIVIHLETASVAAAAPASDGANQAELENRLKELSSLDQLTGLGNRSASVEWLDVAVDKALKQNVTSSFCYVNLDAYTKTTSKIGISGADILLKEVGKILKDNSPNNCQLARLGDDIFTTLTSGTDIDEALAYAEKIRAKVENHLFEISGITVQITCSISVLMINESTPASQEIILRAMRVSEILTRKGGNAIMQYQAEKDSSLSVEESSIAIINDAIKNEKFQLMFQPIMSLQGDTREHYETLLSLPNDNGGYMSAGDILNAAQHGQGLCEKIDRWVIITAMKALIEHRNKGHDTRLFVNITGSVLQDPKLINWINEAFKESGLPTDTVIFQFSENDVVTYMKAAKTVSEELAKLNISIGIANFGCALNPMNTLKHVAAQYIKLDGSFTTNMQKNKEEGDVIKNLIAELKQEQKQTIVPLVENATALSTLWQAGAHFIQGYYIQAPAPEMTYDFSTE